MKWAATAFVSIDKSNEQGGVPDARMKLFHDLERFRNESRFKNQVLGWIAGNCELGRNDKVSTGDGEAFVRLDDFVEVTPQIADRWIKLRKTNLHAGLIQFK